ncbi:matrixin family metalloprotease [Posidoniimonas polymericola]|uniref:matrixin family metalloprotease n=1 Tax=Posidoniimonas polymericola TaxID=2528002 RepID=UPI0018D34E06|nr:matrixin family metalloprotease [Posidoniimonas polymericola]
MRSALLLLLLALGGAFCVPVESNAFYSNGRWSSTATDSFAQPAGLPVTLSWSIVPDGSTLLNAVGSQSRSSDLIADLDALFNYAGGGADLKQRPWFAYVEQSFERWAEVSGVSLVYEPNDDGVPHGSNANLGVLGVRGDIRLGGATLDGVGGTYGQSGFIPNADLTLDTSDVVRFGDAADDYALLRNTLMHEAGHSLGLAHMDSSNTHVLMSPFVSNSLSYDGPQLDDIRGIHSLYGDRHERGALGGNGSFAAATPLGTLLQGQTITLGLDTPDTVGMVSPGGEDFVSITGAADEDFFVLSVAAPIVVDVTLDPRGRNYTERANSNELYHLVNASSQSDLLVEVFQAGAAEPLLVASAASAGLGESEQLLGVALDSPGEYFLRVAGDSDAVQLYALTLSARPAKPGDYNQDGLVDAADYTAWRDAVTRGELLANETASSGITDAQDYLAWSEAYGTSPAAATAAPLPPAIAIAGLLSAIGSLWRSGDPSRG